MSKALDVLSGNPSLSELMGALRELDQAPGEYRKLRVGISANVTTELFEAALKREAYPRGIRAEVVTGNFDSHVENGRAFLGLDIALYVSFFDRLAPALESRAGTGMSLAPVENKHLSELKLFLEATKAHKQVFVLGMHSFFPALSPIAQAWIDRLNSETRELCAAFPQARFLDPAPLLREVGDAQALNARYYSNFKAPYTLAFWSALTRRMALETRGFQSSFPKVLVLDCDNTLWGGIIGEDLLNGIKLDPHDHPGSVFWRVQQELLALQAQGVLLCLCSKNNAADVEEVLIKHPSQVLKAEHLILKKVNWRDKPGNLREIAQDLNLGLDSFVFVDDSDFECAAVRAQLPMVQVFQVPKALHEFPAMIRQIGQLFVAGGVTAESAAKTDQYRQLAKAAESRATFGSQEEYLKSLGLKLEVKRNDRERRARIAELTQKSNQFNVTTRRYTEPEVVGLMDDPSVHVYSMIVRDQFGDHGLTGILITRDEGKVLKIDSFLMSCRVIGRGIEFAFWKQIFDDAHGRGCTKVEAEYVETAKNGLVKTFFEDLGIPLVATEGGKKKYAAVLEGLPLKAQDHVEVTYVR